MLDAWFPAPALGAPGSRRGPARRPTSLRSPARTPLRGVVREVVEVHVTDLQAPPTDTVDAWLRLHLLSHRLVQPHGVNLDGVFGLLTNVVWTNVGPCAVEGFEQTRLRLRAAGHHVTVLGVDKFPRMTDYVLPSGVRVADADRVRLGAHLATGTTVMHEGFVNFNAGTLGSSMVEGRISAGVVVGDGSDVGGGASIMGTLSGGGTPGHLGRRALPARRQRRASASPWATTAWSRPGSTSPPAPRCSLSEGDGTRVVKARELSGASNVLFRRNSTTGAVEAVPWKGDGIALNAALHAND